MTLQEMLLLGAKPVKDSQGTISERIEQQKENIKKYIGFWRMYPDKFVDFMVGDNPEGFQLFFYQRVFLRIAMRHKYVYATFPRAYSKSFLAVLILIIKCVLYPNAKYFVTTGGKDQAASIVSSKVAEIRRLIPGFDKEMKLGRGESKTGKDDFQIDFKSGSVLTVFAASERTRGQRATGGLIEEAILVDGTILNEIIIPTMNVDRRLPDNTRDPDEVANKSQIYVTTAGYKGTFAYQKLVEILIQQAYAPQLAMAIGGTWRIPVMEGLLSRTFVDELKISGTFTETSFNREYESRWSGNVEGSFFNGDKFDKSREILLPEFGASKRGIGRDYYIFGIDVGRNVCASEIVVVKVMPNGDGSSVKKIVNIFSLPQSHFVDQAIQIKRLYNAFKPRAIVIDGNGMGIGLVDILTVSQVDPDTEETLPPLGVINDDDNHTYKNKITKETIPEMLYIMKATSEINNVAHSLTQSQLLNGKLKFLIHETEAKNKLQQQKQNAFMSVEQRNEKLRPYVLTSILKEQMMNLQDVSTTNNVLLKGSSKAIKKDKFSALEYALYYNKVFIEDKKRKRKIDLTKLMLKN